MLQFCFLLHLLDFTFGGLQYSYLKPRTHSEWKFLKVLMSLGGLWWWLEEVTTRTIWSSDSINEERMKKIIKSYNINLNPLRKYFIFISYVFHDPNLFGKMKNIFWIIQQRFLGCLLSKQNYWRISVSIHFYLFWK